MSMQFWIGEIHSAVQTPAQVSCSNAIFDVTCFDLKLISQLWIWLDSFDADMSFIDVVIS